MGEPRLTAARSVRNPASGSSFKAQAMKRNSEIRALNPNTSSGLMRLQDRNYKGEVSLLLNRRQTI